MATLVCFHAHPDDEAISMGGTMARAAADGHRVVLVLATQGELGEVADGVLRPGETLGERRVAETRAAARILGVDRVEFLGYRDSGMMGEPTNDDADAFWQADVGEVAERLATLLVDERADVLTCYDDHGTYGHPDHIQVHRVGRRAGAIADVPRLYEATLNRTLIQQQLAERADLYPEDEMPDPAEMETFGTPDELITTAVDVTAVIDQKRRAMAAHASQIGEESFFLSLPDSEFTAAFGTEWFIRVDGGADPAAGPARRETWLLG
jgi:LmbE family N-acetylglucosaminyl deacetylase